MVLYPNKMHVVTVEGTGINKLSDLKGKRVSTGLAGQRHRDHGVPHPRSRRHRRQEGPQAGAAGRRRVGQRDQGPQDRRVLLVGGVPTAAVTDLAATPGIKIKLIDHDEVVDAMNKQVRSALREERHPGRRLPGPGQAQCRGRRLEHPGDERQDERPDGLHHRQDAVREEARARRRARRSEEHRPQEPGGRARRSRSIRARRSTSRNRASRSTDAAASRAIARANPGGAMAEAARQEPRRSPEAVAADRLQKAATYIEAEEGATNRYRGALAQSRDRAARRHVAVPPLRGDRDRSGAGPAPGPRRLDAAARLPAVPDRRPLSQPADVVGRRVRRARRRDDRLSARRRRRLLGPQHAAEPRRRLLRRRRSCCSCWRRCAARRAGSCCS